MHTLQTVTADFEIFAVSETFIDSTDYSGKYKKLVHAEERAE